MKKENVELLGNCINPFMFWIMNELDGYDDARHYCKLNHTTPRERTLKEVRNVYSNYLNNNLK